MDAMNGRVENGSTAVHNSFTPGGFTMTLRRSILAFALAAFATAAAAQEYPNKPIKMIVPFPPAGGTDILGRTVANKLAELNKWNVIVDNKPGAGGNIGVDAAAKSPPDGYTIAPGNPLKCTSQVKSCAACWRAVAKMIASAVASLCAR